MNYSVVECVLFAFHQIAGKTKKNLGPVCGLDIVSKEDFTGQPKDIMDIPSPNLAEQLRFSAALKALLEETKPRVAKLEGVRPA